MREIDKQEFDGSRLLTVRGMLGPDSYTLIEKPSQRCESTAQAIVAFGSDRGALKQVCIDPTCKKHKQGSSSLYYARNSEPKDYWGDWAKNLPHNIEQATRRKVLAAVLAKPFEWSVPQDQLRIVASALLPFSTSKDLLDAWKFPSAGGRVLKNGSAISKYLEGLIDAPENSPAADYLPRIVMGLALHESSKDYCSKGGKERLWEAAEALKVDHQKIAAATDKSMREDFHARRQKAQAKTKEAVKAAPKAAKTKPAVREAGKSVSSGKQKRGATPAAAGVSP